jgi:hypothetical protein
METILDTNTKLTEQATAGNTETRGVLREMASNLVIQTELLRQMRDEKVAERAAELAAQKLRKS